MKVFFACFSIVLSYSLCQDALSYDPNFEQRVKYNQSRTKWKIKEGQERINKSRNSVTTYGSSNYGSKSSSYSNNSSSSQARREADARRTPSVSARQSLQTFMIAASRATSLDQLHPYAIKTTREYWGRLDAKTKQQVLMDLKKWTYHAKITGESLQPAVATVSLGGQSAVKGVNLWVENGVWKFSNVIKN